MAALFEPLEVRYVRFANRVVMPPMATDMADAQGGITSENIAYYGRMAAAGMGLLIVEHNFILAEGRVSARQMSISRDKDIAGHRRLVEAVHDSGVKVALQISHSGSNRQNPPYATAVGASPVAHPVSGIVPRELTIAEINHIVESCGQAARRARAAGYDAVEIHAAHGYLLSQFLSPLTNLREDPYGGDRECLALEVFREVRRNAGEEMLLMVRLGMADNPPGLELYPGGLDHFGGGGLAQRLAEAGLDILDVSGGMCGSRPQGVSGEAYFLGLVPDMPLPRIVTGGITRPETAEKIVRSGRAEFVGIGRSLAADPEWIRKARVVLG